MTNDAKGNALTATCRAEEVLERMGIKSSRHYTKGEGKGAKEQHGRQHSGPQEHANGNGAHAAADKEDAGKAAAPAAAEGGEPEQDPVPEPGQAAKRQRVEGETAAANGHASSESGSTQAAKLYDVQRQQAEEVSPFSLLCSE